MPCTDQYCNHNTAAIIAEANIERRRIRLLLQDISDALLIYQEGNNPEVLPMALRRVQSLQRSLT
jgi:hypothetical protein